YYSCCGALRLLHCYEFGVNIHRCTGSVKRYLTLYYTLYPHRATDMPWLYYSPTKASTALKDTSITTQYSPKAQIDIRLAAFALDGTFLGFEKAIEFGQLQLCKDTIGKMQAAFTFGTVYSQECELHVDDLFNQTKHPLIFYDPCILF
ncbi:hypothetical protein AHF37_02530, partial [Paragonimus kellicotti]